MRKQYTSRDNLLCQLFSCAKGFSLAHTAFTLLGCLVSAHIGSMWMFYLTNSATRVHTALSLIEYAYNKNEYPVLQAQNVIVSSKPLNHPHVIDPDAILAPVPWRLLKISYANQHIIVPTVHEEE